MRVVTYNVHGGVGRGGGPSTSLVVEIIRDLDADVVALQEVLDDEGGDESLLRALDRLDYARVIHGPTMRKSRGEYGNVLLVRQEVAERELIDLSVKGREPRGAIRVRVTTAWGPADVVTTHLGLSGRERRWQARRLAQILGPVDGAQAAPLRIGLGDFNEWLPWARSLSSLSRSLGPHRGRATYPAMFPVVRLDRVMVWPPAALDSLTTLRDARTRAPSDHFPLVGTIADSPVGQSRVDLRAVQP